MIMRTFQAFVIGFVLGVACCAILVWYRTALFLPSFSH